MPTDFGTSAPSSTAATCVTHDCAWCKSMCCKAGYDYSALLTRAENERLRERVKNDPELAAKCAGDFSYFDARVGAYKMRKFADNRCVFWEPSTCACRVYEDRPADCRIFPLEYRWFRWMHSPQCPSKGFEKRGMLRQLDAYAPEQVRHLKLLHIRTPESTKDRLWIFLSKVLPVAALYAFYARRRARKGTPTV